MKDPEAVVANGAPPEPRKLEEAEFHDKLRGLYEKDPEKYAYYTSNQKYYQVAIASRRYFERWIQRNAPGKRILDYGCGSGHYSVPTARVAAHVTGIDISPEAVQLSRERAAAEGVADKTTFAVMDGEHLDFPDGSFDVVIVSGVLHHVELEFALSEISRVLAAGRGIFLEAIADNPMIHRYRRRTPHLRTPWETEHILRASSATVMRKYFQTVRVRYFHLAVLGAVPLRRTPLFPLARAIGEGIDALILRVPGLRRMAWMACFEVGQPIPRDQPRRPTA